MKACDVDVDVDVDVEVDVGALREAVTALPLGCLIDPSSTGSPRGAGTPMS